MAVLCCGLPHADRLVVSCTIHCERRLANVGGNANRLELMMDFAILIFIGGILHFDILIASALVPQVLDWKAALDKLEPLFRQLVWVYGLFIVLVITDFGLIS